MRKQAELVNEVTERDIDAGVRAYRTHIAQHLGENIDQHELVRDILNNVIDWRNRNL
jgi:hypothetical protein